MAPAIGTPYERGDALAKVLGAAEYPGDLIRPGMLHLQLILADRPHARILAIDTARALAVPGVTAVLTAADVPYNRYGLVEADQPVLCDEKVRFIGDRVALVVAESAAIARQAARLVTVEYENLPVVGTLDDALGATTAVHAHAPDNITSRCPIRKGDARAALAAAHYIVHGEFTTRAQEHVFLQPEAGIAHIDEAGCVVVETAGQWLHEDRRQIAEILGLAPERVIVRYAAVGGAFGGREDLSVQHLLALAAWVTRRPVAMVWDRSESIRSHHKRHPVRIRCSWGADAEGRLMAVTADIVADGGAYASTSGEVLKCMALFATGPYSVPNVAVDAAAVYTNNIPSGAFRGFGAPQAHMAAESMAARLALACGLDGVTFRRKNLYREGDLEPTQQPLPAGVHVRECLEAVVAAMQARPPHEPRRSDHVRRGWGVACAIKNLGYSFGYPEQANAQVELHGNADIDRATVRIGAAEVGQGVQTILRQIAAEVLSLPIDRVDLISDDSAAAPNAGSASASRLTIMAGKAVHDAALAALELWRSEERPATAMVTYRPPATTALDAETTAGRPNYAYGYAAQAVEVEVDELSGLIRVLTVLSAHDVGRVLNPRLVEGQIEGGVVQALGYTLLESFRQQDGLILTGSLSTYLIPTILDAPPDIVPILLEHPDQNGPFGARGVAELPMIPFAPAVAAAVHDACGVWLSDLPFTPDRVLDALGYATDSAQMEAAI